MDDLEESLKRGKRNRKIWNMLQKNTEESQTEEREELSVFRNRRVYKRESFKDSFWYIFMQRDLTDLTKGFGRIFNGRFLWHLKKGHLRTPFSG